MRSLSKSSLISSGTGPARVGTVARVATGVALLSGLLLLAACGGTVRENVREDYARKCAAKGLTPDDAGWTDCIRDERDRPDNSLKDQNAIRWGI